MVTDRLFRRLRKLIQTEDTLAKAADKAGVDEKTARKYRDSDPLPSQRRVPHTWRTREDPFQDVWPELVEQLRLNPGLQAKTLFDDLQRRYPGRFPDVQLRCLQRRIKQWRALEGPPKEVFFAQNHEPGRLAESDFTHMGDPRRHHRRRTVRPPGLPLRADVFQLGGRHGLLLRELREPQRRAAERLVGTGRSSSTAPHRSLDRGGQHRSRARDVHSEIPGPDGALRPRSPGDPAATGQRERRRRAEPLPVQAGRRPGPDAAGEPRVRRPRRLSDVPHARSWPDAMPTARSDSPRNWPCSRPCRPAGWRWPAGSRHGSTRGARSTSAATSTRCPAD